MQLSGHQQPLNPEHAENRLGKKNDREKQPQPHPEFRRVAGVHQPFRNDRGVNRQREDLKPAGTREEPFRQQGYGIAHTQVGKSAKDTCKEKRRYTRVSQPDSLRQDCFAHREKTITYSRLLSSR